MPIRLDDPTNPWGRVYTARQFREMDADAPPGTVAPIATFDFSAPAVQSLPTTAAGLAALIGGGTSPSHIWKFDGTSGDETDLVGSADLEEVNAPIRNQNAVIWNGSDWITHRAAEVLENTSNGFDLGADTSTLDLGSSDSLAVLCVVRCPVVPSTNYVLWEKRDNSFGAGYELRLASTGYVLLAEDAVGGSNTAVISSDTNLYDGAWHAILAVFDFDADEMRLYTDFASASNSAVLDSGESWASTNAFSLLSGPNRNSAAVQIAYAAAWTGAAAEGITGLGTFWTLGDDPTGLLTDSTHASLISHVVGDDSGDVVSHFHGGSGHGIDQTPFGYHTGLTNTNKLAIAPFATYTNLFDESEALDGWNNTAGITKTANAIDSPDGFMRGVLVEGTDATNYIEHPTVTVSATTTYTFSVWLKLKDSASATIRLRYADGFGSTDDEDVTATDEWVRYTHTFTTSANTTADMRIYAGDGSSVQEDVYCWGAQLVAGENPGPYVRALGSSASGSVYNPKSDDQQPTSEGGIAVRYLYSWFNGSTEGNQITTDTEGTLDRRTIYREDHTGDLLAQIRDGAGTILTTLTIADPFTVGVENYVTLQWLDGAAETVHMAYGGSTEASGVEDLDPAEATRDLRFGGSVGTSLNGLISRVEVYGKRFF